jgi:hypothetical protein
MENRKINILGTEYRIETHKVSEDSYLEDNKLSGYCGEEEKLIVVADMSEEKYFTGMDEKAQEAYRKRVLRHEIMHAFLNESGLSDSSNQYSGAWAKNEEMVDWFAIQSPKIFKVYAELDILDMSVPGIPLLETGKFSTELQQAKVALENLGTGLKR